MLLYIFQYFLWSLCSWIRIKSKKHYFLLIMWVFPLGIWWHKYSDPCNNISSWCLSQSHWYFSEVWFNHLMPNFPYIQTKFCLDSPHPLPPPPFSPSPSHFYSYSYSRLFKNHIPLVFPRAKWLPFIDVFHSSLISPIKQTPKFLIIWLYQFSFTSVTKGHVYC